MTGRVEPLVEHLFRHASGRIVASLARQFGSHQIELAEDAVQEALVRALRFWPYRGVPDKPEAWLRRVAHNAMIDALRRADSRQANITDAERADIADRDVSDADLLNVMALCCDPAIAPDARVALILKLVAGFSVEEIARAFLARESTVAQKLTRARRAIRQLYASTELPAASIEDRRETMAAALYLIFNEGYALSSGDVHVSHGLCREAIRLTELMSEQLATYPAIDALLALMYFQAARLPTRIGADGEILTLEEQDRRRWNRRYIDLGVEALNRSARGDELTAYHLQAAIASYHSLSPSYAGTDWQAILDHYDLLRKLSTSPLVRLNRCVALSMVAGPDAGLRAVDALMADGALRRYALLYATAGQLAGQCGDVRRAEFELGRALGLVDMPLERRLIERKITRLKIE